MEKLAQVPDIGGYIQSPAIVLATSPTQDWVLRQ